MMKKVISMMLVVLMLGLVFAGCGGPTAPAGANDDGGVDLLNEKTDEPAADESADETAAADNTNAPAADSSSDAASGSSTSTGYPVTDSYTAYMEAKGVMVNKLMDGLSNNPDTAMTVLSLLGVSMVDLTMLPVSFFGMGQESVAAGMGFMGATGVQYTENGNSYSVTYTDSEGATYVFNGTYDAATDSLVSTATKDGKESIYSEYHKTSFGYVGQFYSNNDDGTTNLYQFAIEGEDGTIGMSMTETAKPAALTGSEAADFPTSSPEWYAVHGTTITGKTSDGTALNFEYTPTPSE